MPSLYIKERSVKAVVAGSVKQVIRRRRRLSVQLGDRLYIYTDNKVRPRRRLRETKCDDVLPVFIDSNRSVIVGNDVLDEKEKHDLALASGFDCFSDMFNYFYKTGGFPMDGQLIKWL